MVEQMLDRGYFAEGFAGLNHIESELLFWQGRAATVFVGSWFNQRSDRSNRERTFPCMPFAFPQCRVGAGIRTT